MTREVVQNTENFADVINEWSLMVNGLETF